MAQKRLCLSSLIARAVDVMMARAKRIYILMIKINKLFSFFRRGMKKEKKTTTRKKDNIVRTMKQNHRKHVYLSFFNPLKVTGKLEIESLG